MRTDILVIPTDTLRTTVQDWDMVLGKFFRMETVVLVLAYMLIPTVSNVIGPPNPYKNGG